MKKKKIFVLVVLLLAVIILTASGCISKNITEYPTLGNASYLYEKVVGKVLGSTCTVTCRISNGVQGGSGVVVSSDGYVLTNYHVIKGAIGDVTIRFADPNTSYETEYKAKIIKEIEDGTSYSKMDLALLKIQTTLSNFVPVTLKAEKVVWGECGVIIGNPRQLGTMCAQAMVSNPSRRITHGIKEANFTTSFISLDAPVNHGNSGGGFFDANGRLAGIVTLRQQDDSTSNSNENVIFGIGYAIPVTSIKGYLARHSITLVEQ